MHSPMLRALKRVVNELVHTGEMSDASSDVEGIETKQGKVIQVLDPCQMRRPMLRALKPVAQVGVVAMR